MTDIDTAALRAAAEDAEQAAYAVSVSLHPATVRALCDGYDEAARLRARLVSMQRGSARWRPEREAARQAVADLVADLRALVNEAVDRGRKAETLTGVYMTIIDAEHLRAVIDRHAPEEGR